jgi:hypothetical protein
MIDLGADLKKAQLNMKQVAHGDNPVREDVLAAAAEINSIKGQMAAAKIEHKFNLKDVLTKEQLEKWKKCQKQCSGKCGPGACGCGGHGIKGHSGIPCDPAQCPKHGAGKHGGK